MLYFSGSGIASFLFSENCGEKGNKYTGISASDLVNFMFTKCNYLNYEINRVVNFVRLWMLISEAGPLEGTYENNCRIHVSTEP